MLLLKFGGSEVFVLLWDYIGEFNERKGRQQLLRILFFFQGLLRIIVIGTLVSCEQHGRNDFPQSQQCRNSLTLPSDMAVRMRAVLVTPHAHLT